MHTQPLPTIRRAGTRIYDAAFTQAGTRVIRERGRERGRTESESSQGWFEARGWMGDGGVRDSRRTRTKHKQQQQHYSTVYTK